MGVVREWCRTRRHLPLEDQQRHLASVIRGHCAYYGVTGNSRRLARFRETVIRSWRYWLGRRHRTGGWIVWGRFSAILARFPLPTAKVTRSIYST